jgi:hypothetical protein
MAVAGDTIVAAPAAGVDVRDDAPAEPARVTRRDHLTDGLVAQHAAVAHVPSHELEIRIANACDPHADDGFTGSAEGFRVIVDERGRGSENECPHRDRIAEGRPGRRGGKGCPWERR